MEIEKKKVRTYRDRIAWQRGMQLARATNTNVMPKSEQFGLTNQMRRAAISIPSNIAEGHARQSRADYLKHLLPNFIVIHSSPPLAGY